MITLTDEQADKICEIIDYRFHHFNPTNYEGEGECYTFWPKAMCDYSHKIDRHSGKLIFDKWRELSMEMTEVIMEFNEVKQNKEVVDTYREFVEKLENVKKYLEEEGLL